MHRKGFLIMTVVGLMVFASICLAEEFVIKDYTFTWHAVKVGDVKMDIQKRPDSLLIILSSTGGGFATLSLSPAQAETIGGLLGKTQDYYEKHKKSDDRKSEDVVQSGNYKVYFSSSQGKDFQVRVQESKLFSAAVLLNRSEALKMVEYLGNAEEMAAFVDKRIVP